jgi:hypothetical protein
MLSDVIDAAVAAISRRAVPDNWDFEGLRLEFADLS